MENRANQQKIDVSIIVPIYGVEKYVEESLRSLLTQSKTCGVEFILVNDCTLDRSMEIVERLIEEFSELDIKVINHKENRGIAAARQSGNSLASGEYILHFDSDDTCSSNMVESLYMAARHSDADIVSCDFMRSSSSESYAVREPISSDGFECTSNMLCNRMYGMVWNKLIRRSLYVDNKIEFTEGINLGEDLIFCLKIFCYAKKIVYLPEVFYTYRFREESITSKFKDDKLADIEAYLADIENFFCERGFYSRLKRPLMNKKVIEKLSLMKCSKGKRRKHYAGLYPEATDYIMGCDTIPMYLRKALLSATKGNLLRFNAIMLYRRLRSAVSR